MGFRQGGFMSVWSVEPGRSGNTTKVRLSSSRRNKNTGEYEQDFSGFCTFIGNAHAAAAKLKEKDRIKIIECDVGTTYDKTKGVEYINYKVFEFEMANSNTVAEDRKAAAREVAKRVAEGADKSFAPEGDIEEDDLPY